MAGQEYSESGMRKLIERAMRGDREAEANVEEFIAERFRTNARFNKFSDVDIDFGEKEIRGKTAVILESFVRLGKTHFPSFLSRPIRHTIINMARKRNRRPRISSLDVAAFIPDRRAAGRYSDPLVKIAIKRALKSLESRPNYETLILPVLMYHVGGYSYENIAEISGTQLGTVKSRIHRGILILRDELKKHLPD